MTRYDIIVIGAGHAGAEAALVCARMGHKSLLLTMNKARMAYMPCNPSIGGVGKGQLVKEIDALGGEMAKAADFAGIHFKILNKSHGPAVWSSRVQVDRHRYSEYMSGKLCSEKNLIIIEDEACALSFDGGKTCLVRTACSGSISAGAVILTPGTFLNGIIHIGLDHEAGGCYKEPASIELSLSLKKLGLEIATLKTGTTPRVKKDSIDFSGLTPQYGDEQPVAFSFSTKNSPVNRIVCHMTHTNQRTHDIIRKNLTRSPLFTGIIKSKGVRYCPSIEDKVVKFPQRSSHHVFLEPEGLDTDWYYPNGLSTSLPLDVQEDILHSIKGLEAAKIVMPGYGIEYEFVQPTELMPTLQVKKMPNLFLAGQINGTTGYEEAAAQGLMAGINAVLKIENKSPLILSRQESYIGVLIDDLVTKGTDEPYRMFTSRAEYRLLLREDNADVRLRHYGHRLGLVLQQELAESQEKDRLIKNAVDCLSRKRVFPGERINGLLEGLGMPELKKPISALELLRRPQIRYFHIKELNLSPDGIPPAHEAVIETVIKYEGFINRQQICVKKMQDIEKINLPSELDYMNIPGLSSEIIQKLQRIRPVSLGQASRISGITPSAVMILMVYLKKYKARKLA
ncbi:MAG: tRNA uridine-5-carboxymethylaminomethyl(34) synthesis enzyme MnmG [Candidatus Omnitrophica bacterium]|nr:tRNA uridine-5-carboxymethylaminomethyl(34) synthesis enzyme MnmG [Candidatus Omnitrophota bacterium]